MMFSIFPCVCWPSVRLLWKNVFLCLLIYLFIYIELQELSVYFRDLSFLHCFTCKYFSPSLRSVFSSYDFLCYAEFLFFVCLFNWVHLFVLFFSVWEVDQKWSCWGLCPRVSACIFLLRVLQCLALHLCL